MRSIIEKKEIGPAFLVAILLFLSLPFGAYALKTGILFATENDHLTTRLLHAGALVSNGAMYGHMIAGGVLMALAPLQLLPNLRRLSPMTHRAMGYTIAVLAAVTGVCGLCYILLQGTIGGPVMNVGFGLYGALMICAALRTVQLARARNPRHRLWAERLVILAMASWIYRLHYGLWALATGGMGSRPDFSGPFDLVQVFAFYLPYLVIHNWHWSRRTGVHHRLG